jgi:hypothetical protein
MRDRAREPTSRRVREPGNDNSLVMPHISLHRLVGEPGSPQSITTESPPGTPRTTVSDIDTVNFDELDAGDSDELNTADFDGLSTASSLNTDLSGHSRHYLTRSPTSPSRDPRLHYAQRRPLQTPLRDFEDLSRVNVRNTGTQIPSLTLDERHHRIQSQQPQIPFWRSLTPSPPLHHRHPSQLEEWSTTSPLSLAPTPPTRRIRRREEPQSLFRPNSTSPLDDHLHLRGPFDNRPSHRNPTRTPSPPPHHRHYSHYFEERSPPPHPSHASTSPTHGHRHSQEPQTPSGSHRIRPREPQPTPSHSTGTSAPPTSPHRRNHTSQPESVRELWSRRREEVDREEIAREEEPQPGRLPVRVRTSKNDSEIVEGYGPRWDRPYPEVIRTQTASNSGARIYVAWIAESPGIYTTWSVAHLAQFSRSTDKLPGKNAENKRSGT